MEAFEQGVKDGLAGWEPRLNPFTNDPHKSAAWQRGHSWGARYLVLTHRTPTMEFIGPVGPWPQSDR